MTACAEVAVLRALYRHARTRGGKSEVAAWIFEHLSECKECAIVNEIMTEFGKATVIGRNPAGDEWLVCIGRNGHSDEEWRELSPLNAPCVFRWIDAPEKEGSEA